MTQQLMSGFDYIYNTLLLISGITVFEMFGISAKQFLSSLDPKVFQDFVDQSKCFSRSSILVGRFCSRRRKREFNRKKQISKSEIVSLEAIIILSSI